MRVAQVLAVCSVAGSGAAVAASPPHAPAAGAPPLERDCARWEAPRNSVFDRGDERYAPLTGVFAERMPNVDPAYSANPAAVARRPMSIELLVLCEQLNVKDKLDYLIRRLGR